MDDDEDEGDEEVEEEPDVDHLQVGGVWQAIIHLVIQFWSILSVSIAECRFCDAEQDKF